MQKKEMVITQ